MLSLVDEVFAADAPSDIAPPPSAKPAPPSPDRWERARVVLAALAPEVLGQVDEALLAEDTGGPEALRAYLERAAVDEDLEIDTLDEARAVLRAIKRRLPTIPDGKLNATAGTLLKAALAVEAILRRRPRVDGPDEVTARLVAVRDKAVERIQENTRERAGKFTRARKALEAWAANLGPVLGPELVRRMDEMLGGPTT